MAHYIFPMSQILLLLPIFICLFYLIISKSLMLESDYTTNDDYIIIWESELQALCGLAISKWEVEIGGEIYGFLTRNRRIVIGLISPNGPHAELGKVYFKQDIEFTKKITYLLFKKFLIDYFGSHHSHHHLGLESLSNNDICSMNSIAVKNHLAHYCQIVVSFEKHIHSNKNDKPSLKTGNSFDRCPRNIIHPPLGYKVRVRAFLYNSTKSRYPSVCDIKVLPGISPFRKAISNQDKQLGCIHSVYFCPLDNIIYDDFEKPKGLILKNNGHKLFFERIINQVSMLPKEVQEKFEMIIKEDTALITIPVPMEGKMFIKYDLVKNYKIKSVFFIETELQEFPLEINPLFIKWTTSSKIDRIYKKIIKATGNNS